MQVASDKRICQMHSKINGKRGILVLCVVVTQIMGPLHYSSIVQACINREATRCQIFMTLSAKTFTSGACDTVVAWHHRVC